MTRRRRPQRTLRVIALAAAATACAVAPAAAHIQVRPAHAAPDDPVLWTVLVPAEAQTGTRQVELAVPNGVLPFSYEHAAGWTRRLRLNADGSVRSIVWRGRTSADGLATFRFMASTPARAGTIAWKAIQTYRDGAIVRWIGSAGSEHPASITAVWSSVPRENAGGATADAGVRVPASFTTPAPAGAPAGATGPDWLARSLALTALLAVAATTIARRRRR